MIQGCSARGPGTWVGSPAPGGRVRGPGSVFAWTVGVSQGNSRPAAIHSFDRASNTGVSSRSSGSGGPGRAWRPLTCGPTSVLRRGFGAISPGSPDGGARGAGPRGWRVAARPGRRGAPSGPSERTTAGGAVLRWSVRGRSRHWEAPKFWVQRGPPGAKSTPTPMSLNAQLRMLARWPGLAIQAFITSAGDACPAAMFSPDALHR